LAGIKCGHCGKDHDAGTKFCPETGKSIGPAAGGRATMLMFQPGTKLPGSSAPAGVPPAGTPAAAPAATTPTPAVPPAAVPTRVAGPGSGTIAGRPPGSTPSAGVPLAPPRSTPSGGVPLPRPRLTPSGALPTTSSKVVPPPPVATDGVPPPPVGGTPGEGVPQRQTSEKSAATGSKRTKSVPEWVAQPQGGSSGYIPSAVFPAVDAPEKGIVDLVKEALGLYKQHLKVFLITAAVLFVPGALVSSALSALVRAPLVAPAAELEERARELQAKIVSGTLTPQELQRAQDDLMRAGTAALGSAAGGFMATLLTMLATALIVTVLWMVVLPLVQGALTVAVADRMLGGQGTWQDYWRWFIRGRAKLFLSAILPAAVLVFIGSLFFAIPGLVLSFFFALIPPVVMLEGVGGVPALKRSFQLVKSDWLRVLLVALLFGVSFLVTYLLVALLVPGHSLFLHELIGNLLMLVLLPLPILAVVLVYLDIRRKHESFDRDALRTQLEELRTPAPG
jgi:hypothetical protein